MGDDYLTKLINQIVDAKLASMHVAQPAIVEKFDPVKMTVQVRPALKIATATKEGREDIQAASIVDVPVIMPAVAGFGVTLPIAKGDYVLLIFMDRNIDAFHTTGDESQQVEYRQHHLSDAIAIPGWKPDPKTYGYAANRDANIAAYDSSSIQIRSFDGNSGITITPGGDVTINTGGVTFSQNSGGIEIAGGDITMNGNTMFIDGVDIGAHIHQETGSDTLAPKNP